MITLVTPFMIVVLPERGMAGLIGIIVAPEMTRSDVPEIRVGEAVMGDTPINEAIAEAIAAAEEEAGDIVVGFGLLSDPRVFGEEGGDEASGALGVVGATVFEASGLDRLFGGVEGEFSVGVEVCCSAGDSVEGEGDGSVGVRFWSPAGDPVEGEGEFSVGVEVCSLAGDSVEGDGA